ncbi:MULTISPECIES: helix-turn-helix domain-containing protein [Chryseobacterium]|uniref:AraC family transcriptional activator of pobA n=1 Tax=Chryseobacterium camelliae TaxID=1265445 RepID=A0ABU0TDS2_9FLAO|nr:MULTISPECIES: helix-turn-helix transcriptional regulator [Chryseobacterium]MDT3407010.1 AraC family transcriptional activator of pobA [Pseudacidovorax intermedius]MDQ1095199.1 AraC family transcriptional activator of pobA [Chryseobacterium camelliae]MDQ1099136.1 AraC family transcriptional activator of pobA [Chryseobacterium sp. SORGH_AS_1048]MDR6086485.1 AraC family transcriptional activator of pobA [Chryseobacterium sp. SORGH_AS_0909]MDR6130857.1 AraC family transcriptional activator of p
MEQRQIQRIKTISEFHQLRGLPKPEHPLISVVNYSSIKRPSDIGEINLVLDFYMISQKSGLAGKMYYGQQEFDFDEGVMAFIEPNQVFRIQSDPTSTEKRSGWMLLIHPDFLWNTPLAKTIRQYDYFDYSVNEALFLSEKEQKTLNGIIENIRQEYHTNMDRFSKQIIVSQIESLLNYSERFYNRQFLTREKTNHDILGRLESLLTGYFDDDDLAIKGLPTVQYIAEALHVSPKYLSSLLKLLTGQSTQQHIHDKLISKAKEKLSTTNLSVSEIAYDLGFEHSQSFSKLFKTKTQMSPLEFRASFY